MSVEMLISTSTSFSVEVSLYDKDNTEDTINVNTCTHSKIHNYIHI